MSLPGRPALFKAGERAETETAEYEYEDEDEYEEIGRASCRERV
jgi:hypothetical protein